MNRLIIGGKSDAAGEYELPDNFSFREMHVIKRITQLRAGEIYPAMAAGDTDVVAAFAIVAVTRAKPWVDAEKLVLDSEIDEVSIVLDPVEEDETPLPADDATAEAPTGSA